MSWTSMKSEKASRWKSLKEIKQNKKIIHKESNSFFLAGRSSFSVELYKRKSCICAKRASGRQSLGHCLNSKRPRDGGNGPCSKLISSATFSLLFCLKFGTQARSFYAWVCMTSLILLETSSPPTPYPHRSMPPALEKIKNQPIHFTWAYRTSEKLILCCLLIKTQMFYKMLIQFSNRKPCLNSSVEPELQDKERKCIQIEKGIFELVFNFHFTLPQDFRVIY